MTTIVYDHKNKQIACDSRTTSGTFICTDCAVKYKTVNDELWFFTGKVGEIDVLIDNFNPLSSAPENLEVYALVVIKKRVFMRTIDKGVFRESEVNYNDGMGSGDTYAITAVDLGKTAKEAVEYAATRDNATGGKVHVYDIEKDKFI